MLSLPQDGIWNDIDLQLSSMPAPSLSRRASTQRPSTTSSTLQRGNSMRIVKPSQQGGSTHNSPLGLGLTSKAQLGRRMTVMGDTSGYRRRRLLEATAAIGQQQQAQIAQNNHARMRAGTMAQQRPVSWCPSMSSDANISTGMDVQTWPYNTSTQQTGEAILRRQAEQYSPESQLRLQQLQQWQQLQMAQAQQQAQAQAQQLALAQREQIERARRMAQAQAVLAAQQQALAAQEGNYFAMAQQGVEGMQTPYFSQQSTPLQFPSYALPMGGYYAQTPMEMEMGQQQGPYQQQQQQQDFSLYNNFAVPNSYMASSTTPPTPETFPMADQFQAQYIGTHGSNDAPFFLDSMNGMNAPVEEGEVLVGLGLYSAPDKKAKPVVDGLDSQVMALYQRSDDKGGKGLKLEDSWEPPVSDGEEDAEGEEEEGQDEEGEGGEMGQLQGLGQGQGMGVMGPPVGWL